MAALDCLFRLRVLDMPWRGEGCGPPVAVAPIEESVLAADYRPLQWAWDPCHGSREHTVALSS